MTLQPDQAQFVLHFRLSTDPEDMLVTFGVDVSTITGGGAATDAEAIADAFTDTLLPQISSAYALTSIDLDIGVTGGVERTTVPLSGAAGGVSGAVLMSNTAYLLHKLTGAIGRGKNGRAYIPGVVNAAVSDAGVIDTGTVATLNGLAGDFFDAWTAATLTPVVNHGPTSALGLFSEVTAFTVDPLVATQRRRLRP